MHGLIEIYIGSRIIGNIYNYGKFSKISGNFRKFPPSTKFPENLQPYAGDTGHSPPKKIPKKIRKSIFQANIMYA